MRKFMLAGAALLALSVSQANAADASGVWLRDNGHSRIRIAPCGPALCGSVVWLRDSSGNSKVGQRVFYNMKPSRSNQWSGNAFNPDDGKTYNGKMTLSGNTLTTSGCVLGGLICRSVTWTRVN